MHFEDAQLPYCLTSWPELDGRQVLFNRNYEPIWQRLPGCPAVPANPEERIARWGNDYFYDECNSPPKRPDPWRSKKTRQILEAVLAEFIAGRDVSQWVVSLERTKRKAHTARAVALAALKLAGKMDT
jgi:hypothetical protein